MKKENKNILIRSVVIALAISLFGLLSYYLGTEFGIKVFSWISVLSFAPSFSFIVAYVVIVVNISNPIFPIVASFLSLIVWTAFIYFESWLYGLWKIRQKKEYLSFIIAILVVFLVLYLFGFIFFGFGI